MIRYAAAFGAALFLAGCEEPKKPNLADQRRSTNIEDVRPNPNVIYGDEVFLLARRGMGGKLTDHATWYFAYDAHLKCGVRFDVKSGQAWSEYIFRPTHRAMRARKLILVGTSLGGLRATEHAYRWAKEGNGAPVRLLLVDTVPWTPPIPKNVGKDHVVWRNTLANYGAALGGGKPKGAISDKQHDRPEFTTHGLLIHSAQTRKEVVEEICRGITHPRERKK